MNETASNHEHWNSAPALMNNESPRSTTVEPDETLPEFAADHELLRELQEDLRATLPGYLNRLHTGIVSANPEMVRVTAHTLKGCFANFGKNGATRIASELEILAQNSELESAGSIFAQLPMEIDRLFRRLNDVLQSRSDTAVDGPA